MNKFIAAFFILAIAVHGQDISQSETLAQKQQYCDSNKYTCSVNCAGNPKVNTCDPNTLGWNCLCSNGKFPSQQPPSQYPIEQIQCAAEIESCVAICVRDLNPSRDFCSAKCKNEKKCGTMQTTQTKKFRVEPTGDGKVDNADNAAGQVVAGSISAVLLALAAIVA